VDECEPLAGGRSLLVLNPSVPPHELGEALRQRRGWQRLVKRSPAGAYTRPLFSST